MTIAELLTLAFEHHQGGRLAQAEQLYRQVLQRQPDNVDALRLLGILARNTGHAAAGIELLNRAARLAPHSQNVKLALAEAHLSEADALQQRDQIEHSIQVYQRALSLNPTMAEGWSNLGVALQRCGQIEAAAQAYQRAVGARPDYPEPYSNLADALRVLGRGEEAVAAAEAALRLRPDYAEALNHLGSALLQLGRREEAVEAYRSAIRCNPALALAHNNLGNALAAMGLREQARDSYRQAIRVDPGFAEAISNLGNLQRDSDQLSEALESHRAAVALKPHIPEIHNNYGNTLREAGEIEQALAEYRAAIQLQADFMPAWSNFLYSIPFDPSMSGRAILDEHVAWSQRFAAPLAPRQPPPRDAGPNRRLRIGYVSGDLREHPVGRFMLPLLANHDRSAIEIFCYADVARPDAITQRLRQHVDTWRDTLALYDQQLSDVIRSDGIDILVDLAVHSSGNRMLVFARQPAPVQVTYLGYPGTTGLETMGYRLTDRFLDPPDAQRPYYTERSLHLRTTYWCYGEPDLAPPVSEAPLRARGHITFGCLNTFAKVSTPALRAWAQILAATPQSRIVMQAGTGPHRDRVREIFAERGVSADRIDFLGRLPMDQYFAAYSRIDIALDPFPCTGGTTTCDTLWMGVPIVSLAGDIAVRRTGASLLALVGLDDLVTDDVAAYVAKATALARDEARVVELRATLRERMRASPIMDAPAFTRDIERCYREMWQATP